MTLFVNRLTQLDVSLWCPERGLIGASWQVDAELDGDLGKDGMLFDFGEVKPWIKSRLDGGADHTLLVPSRALGISVQECQEGLAIRAQGPYPLEVRGPRQAFTLLPWQTINVERLSEHLSKKLMRHPPPRVKAIRLTLREESIDSAVYTYSHGLKHHVGNCQRIAHGHRSRLEIWHQGRRDRALEAHWAAWLADRYLVDAEDLVDQGDSDTLNCRYHAPQGTFMIRLPRERCAILPYPTTIEHIAAWLAEKVAKECGERVKVRVFEGIDKGAIAEAGA